MSYDLAGNMITQGTKSYTFDGPGRLKGMTGPSGSQGTYRFDAMGRRVKRIRNYQDQFGSWADSVISVFGPAGELLADYKNDPHPIYGDTTTTTYHVQMDGQTVARRVIGTITGGSVDRTEWLHRNHLNQVVGVDYDNYLGQVAGYSQPYNSGGPDQFHGHKDDPESGLHYNLARSYSPTMARWISADPVLTYPNEPRSLNKYAYNVDDPINYVDKEGLFVRPPISDARRPPPSPWPTTGSTGHGCHSIYLDGTYIGNTCGGAGPAPSSFERGPRGEDATTEQSGLLSASLNRTMDMLADVDCAKTIGAANSAKAQEKLKNMDVGFKSLGVIKERADGTLKGTVARYNPILGFRNIRLNTNINWANPNDTKMIDKNNNETVYRALDNTAAELGVSSVTSSQFMDLSVLHELAHSFGVSFDKPGSEKTIWSNCFK